MSKKSFSFTVFAIFLLLALALAPVVAQTESSVQTDTRTSLSNFSKTPIRNLLQTTKETNDFKSEKNAYGINITIFQKSPIGINSTNGGYIWHRVDWKIYSEYHRITEVNELILYFYDSSSSISRNTTISPLSYDYSNYREVGPSVGHRRYDISVTIENGSKLSNYLDVYTEFVHSVWDKYENAESPITFVCSKSGTHLLLHSTRTEESARFKIIIQDKTNKTIYSNIHDQNSYYAYLIAYKYGIYGSNDTSRFGSTPDKLSSFDTPLSEILTVRAEYISSYHQSGFSVFNYQNKTILYPQPTELELQEDAKIGRYEKVVDTSSWMYGMGCAQNGSIFWNNGWVVYHYNGQMISSHDYEPDGFGGVWAINSQPNGQLYFSVNAGSKGNIFNVTGPTITYPMSIYERPNFNDYIRGFDVAENGTIYFYDDNNAIYKVINNKEHLVGTIPSNINWLCLGANDSLLISTGEKIYRLENSTFVKYADPKTSLTHFAEFSNGTLVFSINDKNIYHYWPTSTDLLSVPLWGRWWFWVMILVATVPVTSGFSYLIFRRREGIFGQLHRLSRQYVRSKEEKKKAVLKKLEMLKKKVDIDTREIIEESWRSFVAREEGLKYIEEWEKRRK